MKTKALLAGLALLAITALPVHAETIGTATFTSDHCTDGCGPQAGGFGTITGTDFGNGTIDISISLANGNTFANGGQQVVFGFNLVGNPTVTYSNLSSNLFTIPNVIPVNMQNAGALTADGFGVFEYGLEGTFNGASNLSTLSFTLSAAGLSLASFAELSKNPPGDTQAFFGLDIFSGTTGKTGFVDVSGGGTPFNINPVPIPAVGTGLPGILAGALFLFRWMRRRRDGLHLPEARRFAVA
jgi:hypothetical protein